MCNPTVEEKIPYSADLHEHLVGKGGKTHRYLESNSSAVITFSKTSISTFLLLFTFSINFEVDLSLSLSVSVCVSLSLCLPFSVFLPPPSL